ncbi:MAG: hypothetical protein ACR2JV_08510 [Gaiellales bacterium]
MTTGRNCVDGAQRVGRAAAVLPFALLALVLIVGLVPTPANAEPTAAWETPCGDIAAEPFFCSVIANRAMMFGSTPGVLRESKILRVDVTMTKGEHLGDSSNEGAFVNQSMWSLFGNTGFAANLKDVVGEVKVAVGSSSTTPYPVSVVASGPHVSQKVGDNGISAATLFGLSCTSESYLACVTPGTWRDNRSKNGLFTQYPERFTGFAAIETRPLIVKVINMTSQPLVPDGNVRVDNMLRSRSIAAPTQIDGLSDTGRPGVGYYHLYRDSVRDGSVSLTYRFVDGPEGEVALTREYIDATVDVSRAAAVGSVDPNDAETVWSTDKSKCEAPKSLASSVECSVTVLGSADGTLEAVVVVNG